jgi:hypothetical protein
MSTSFLGTVTTFRTIGNAAVLQDLLAIKNGKDSDRSLKILALILSVETTAALTAVMPNIVTYRTKVEDQQPGGGTSIDKVGLFPSMGVGGSLDIVALGATDADGAVLTPITQVGGIGDRVWQSFGRRMHTLVGEVQGITHNLLPPICEKYPLVINPAQALFVRLSAAAAASNPATNHYIVQAVIEETHLHG